MATSGTPEAREREYKLKERESINTSRGRFYETRRKIEVNIESLEKKKECLLSSSSTAEERECETEKKNLAANLELANHVRRLAAYVNERTGQLEKSGVKIDFTEMPTVAALLELTKNPENLTKQEQSKKMALFFTDSAVLALDRELRGLRDVLTEKRTYTPQELSLAVLTEVNKKKYGYTQDTANFMAATCYVRIATEKNLRDAKRQTIEERAKHDLKGVDKYPFDEMLKRIVRDEAKGSITPSEESVLEGLSGSMSLDDLRKTLAEGSVSIDSLKFVMYNLVSTIAPRKCNDGSMVTLKGPKDIAEVEKLVDNLNRITSEYAALEVMSNAKSISKSDPSKFGVVALADGLKAYQTKFDASERQIIIASKHRESYMTTRAKSKAILAELLATAKAEGW